MPSPFVSGRQRSGIVRFQATGRVTWWKAPAAPTSPPWWSGSRGLSCFSNARKNELSRCRRPHQGRAQAAGYLAQIADVESWLRTRQSCRLYRRSRRTSLLLCEVGPFFVALRARVSMLLSQHSDLSSRTHSGSVGQASRAGAGDCSHASMIPKSPAPDRA